MIPPDSPDGPPVLLSAGDALTEAQSLRLAEAVGLLLAARAALDAGVPTAEVALYRWEVTVELAAPAGADDERGRGVA